MSKATAAPKVEKGLSFPVDSKGERSTTLTGKNILAAAIRGSGAPNAEELAKKCESEKNWRFKYNKHYMKMVEVSAWSHEAALGVANAGINYMHSNFEFVDPTDSTKAEKFDRYMASKSNMKCPWFTGVVEGTKRSEPAPRVSVPYKGGILSGETLKKQLTRWAKYGTIEPDAADSILSMVDEPLDLRDQHFILIGAGSAMGPFSKLLEHGATVVALDIPGAWGPRAGDLWNRLTTTARNSRGRLLFPMNKPQEPFTSTTTDFSACGCSLTESTAEILSWLKTIDTNGKGITVGNYTYLDGDLHVKLSLAADAVIDGLSKSRPNVSIAFLCTPTDIHFIPDEAHRAALKRFGFHPGKAIEFLINLLTGGTKLVKNALKPVKTSTDQTVKLVDGLSVAQGPNYALAKRLQHWRAIVAYNGGQTVSTNIAPSTSTLSVVSNKSFAWAYGGMPYFKPFEIFQQDTTNAVMATLLAYDIVKKDSVANPANRDKKSIRNPLELFKWNSIHGGLWRAAYKVDSIGEVSAIIYFLGGPKAFLPIVYTIIALITFAIVFFLKK